MKVVEAHNKEAKYWNVVTSIKCIILAVNQRNEIICDTIVDLDEGMDGEMMFRLAVATKEYCQILERELEKGPVDDSNQTIAFEREQPSNEIRSGTVVFHPHLLRIGTVERIAEDKAFVVWDECPGAKRKARTDSYRLDILIPTPIRRPVRPCQSQSRIVIIGSSVTSLIGRCGIVKRMGPHHCSVVLDGEQKVRSNIPLRLVHSLDDKKIEEYGVKRALRLGPWASGMIRDGWLPDGYGVHLIKGYSTKDLCCVPKSAADEFAPDIPPNTQNLEKEDVGDNLSGTSHFYS
jgi:hypothetical protein